MTQGYIFLGIDDYEKTQNIERAYALSLSLKLSDPLRETCVVVTDLKNVPKQYENGFDYIVQLPYGRTEINHHNILIDFWQIFHCSPFDDTIFLNTYSLAVDNMDSLWNVCEHHDIVFGTARDFRQNKNYDTEKFMVQNKNNIPTFDADMMYFNKGKRPTEFFKLADPMFKNWREVYRELLSDFRATDFNFTLMVNLVANGLDETYSTNEHFDYTNLRFNTLYDPESEIQDEWIPSLNIWITNDIKIKINNYRQTGLWHYSDPSVIDSETIRKLNECYRKETTKTKA